EALRYLATYDRKRGAIQSALNWARQWADAAPIQERFSALLLVAELLRDSGDAAGSKQAAARANEASKAYYSAASENRVGGTAGQHVIWLRQAQEVERLSREF